MPDPDIPQHSAGGASTGARPRGAYAVDSESDRQRSLLGVHVTAQVVVFVLVALGFTALIGLAVLDWLERTA